MNAIANEWNSLTEEQQLEMMGIAIKRATFYVLMAVRRIFVLQAITDVDELINETWIHLQSRLTDKYIEGLNAQRAERGKPPVTLKYIVALSARAAIKRHEKHVDFLAYQKAEPVKDEDDNTLDRVETVSERVTQHYAPSGTPRPTEQKAIYNLTYRPFIAGLDKIDRDIIEDGILGYSYSEMGAKNGMTKQAIGHRIKKIREAIANI